MNKVKLIIASILMLATASVFALDSTYDLKFERGKISATMESGLVRGDSDTYLFRAGANRALSVAVTAFENNATAEISYRKNGKWVAITGAEDTRAWYGKLPKSQSNRYKIVVGGTRGNATYELFVGISVTDH